jgi:hypothetical protein
VRGAWNIPITGNVMTLHNLIAAMKNAEAFFRASCE